MWLGRHKNNNSLVVFIHGFTGNPWGTWKEIIGRLQERFPADPYLRSYDLHSFQYDSSWRRQPQIRPFVVAKLDTFLRRHRERYHTIALVGHSQGGLVAKLYVLDELGAGRGLDLKVDLIITFGTPHHGLKPLDWLRWLPRVPFVGNRLLQQLFELSSVGANIRFLKEHWKGPAIVQDPAPPSPTSRYIRSIAVVGASDRVVGAKSAAGFPVDIDRYRSGAHPLASSVSELEEDAGIIEEELRAHGKPVDLLRRITTIRTDVVALQNFIQSNERWVAAEVAIRRPGLSPTGRDIKTASLLNDFLNDFSERPLRAIDLQVALQIYIERSLGDDW